MPASPELPDRPARDAIRRNLETTILVEAAAGTGKTTEMVGRVVELLGRGEDPARLAAVTFTRKAAAQLRERLELKLDTEIRGGGRSPTQRDNLARARGSLDRAFIGTIHSFCGRLLRERPVEAGVDPAFREVEEDELLLARESVWQNYIDDLLLKEKETLSELSALGVELPQLKQTYENLTRFPDVRAVSIPANRPDLAPAARAADAFLRRAEGELKKYPFEAERDDFIQMLWAASYRRRASALEDDLSRIRLFEILAVNPKREKAVWPEGEGLYEDFRILRELSIEPALTAFSEYRHPLVLSAVAPAAERFLLERIARGELNFTDLLMIASRMLRENPDVRRYFQDRYRYLLVDEFQDTDPIQAEVMLYLTGESGDVEDWRRLTPRPGSLFIVGDPKQSIYRFRRADIRTYDAVKQIVQRAGGAILELSTNFRSVDRICDWTNGVFEEIFDGSLAHQARHVALSAVRRSKGTRDGVFRLEVPNESPHPKDDELCERDAELIAGWIDAAVSGGSSFSRRGAEGREELRPARFGDFLILLRGRGHLHQYGRALESRGIPFEITGGKAYGTSEELPALLLFLQSVRDPRNPVPLVAFLRSTLSGIDDDALYRFHREGGEFRFRRDPPGGSDPRFGVAFTLLREASGWARELPPGAAIARMCERLGILAGGYTEPSGETRAGNVLRALSEARKLSASGFSFSETVDALEELIAESATEEMNIEPGREDAVRVMNLHQAKGLEAPVVFLAGPIPNRSGSRGPQYHVDRDAAEPEGYFLFSYRAPWNDFGAEEIARPKNWDALRAEEIELAAAEEQRLLYVAATRAMNTLVVSARQGKKDWHYGAWSPFAKFTRESLPAPAAGVSRPAPPFVDLEPEFPGARAAVKLRHEALKRLSYAATSPSKFKAETGFVLRESAGKGLSWGRVMHRLLEALMRDRTGDTNLEKYAENLLRDEERSVEELPELLGLVAAVRESPLWKRALGAEKCLVEVPFATMVKSEDYRLDSSPEETLINGTIDLVFKEKGVWHVVDYKSDKIGSSIDPLVERYTPQLRIYRDTWQSLTKEPARAGLFFLDGQVEHWLD
jgi:ATP-dependent helicase/nuclease subunit A